MQLPYFYQQNISATNQHQGLDADTSKHCIQVLRMQVGEQLQLTNGKGLLATATIIEADKKNCTVSINDSTVEPQLPKKNCIAISLLKNTSRFEWFLEKATELGIAEIIPLLCQRTERSFLKQERMNTILVAAMLQSRQTYLPILQQPMSLQQVIQHSVYNTKLIAHCINDEKQLLKNHPSVNAQILIGPEGDFTQEEIDIALQQGYKPVSLGNTRLRTETAGVVAATLLMVG